MAAFAPPAALRAVLSRHRVILGSKSATRQAILKEMGVPYEIMVRKRMRRSDTPRAALVRSA